MLTGHDWQWWRSRHAHASQATSPQWCDVSLSKYSFEVHDPKNKYSDACLPLRLHQLGQTVNYWPSTLHRIDQNLSSRQKQAEMTDILNTPVAFCRAEDRYLRATSLHRPLNSHNNSFRQALRSPSATSLGEGSSPNGSAQVLHELRRIKLSKPIQSLATSCLDVLEWLSLSITGGQRNSVQRQFHMLRLWCDGLDIANGSLDVRLKEDSRALASSIKFLLDLGLLLVGM